MSTEIGTCTGIHIGPFYYETTSNGDINIGISFGPSGGEGAVGGAEVYGEISFNPKEGFSVGGGVSGEAGVGCNLGPAIKDLSAGVYTTNYVCYDTRE